MSGSRRSTGVVAALTLVSGCLALGLQPGGVVQAQQDPASRAIAYLQAQQQADGSIAGPAGSYADSELFAIGAAADGYDPSALIASSGVSVMDYLAASAGAACTVSDPGGCGELIQAVVAAGEAPAGFGGQDLLTTLEGSYDAATGEYGDGEAFTQALAIQGLVAAGAPVPPAAVSFLVSAQDRDGGWDYRDYANDPDAATDYDQSDTNSTSMVLMALDAAGDHALDASGLAWLATQQDGDGGFPYQAGAGSDPDSTALVVQAIVAAGGDPFAAAWTVGGSTPIGHLEATQDTDGGWTYPGSGGPDPFTTSQVPLALERLALPVPFGSRPWYSPGAALGGSPAASPGPSSTATSSAPPAGVITAPPASASTPTPSPSPPAQVAVVAPTPAAVSPPSPTTPSLQNVAAPSARHPGGGPPPALIYLLVALAVAVVVGGGGTALVTRR